MNFAALWNWNEIGLKARNGRKKSKKRTFHWSMASSEGPGVFRRACTADRSTGIWKRGEMVTGMPSKYDDPSEELISSSPRPPQAIVIGKVRQAVWVYFRQLLSMCHCHICPSYVFIQHNICNRVGSLSPDGSWKILSGEIDIWHFTTTTMAFVFGWLALALYLLLKWRHPESGLVRNSPAK